MNTEFGLPIFFRIFFDPNSAIPNQTEELEAGSPLSGDLISVILRINYPYDVRRILQLKPHYFRIFQAQYASPNDIPDVTAKRYRGLKNTYQMLQFQALSIAAANNLRNLDINQRKCRFSDESNLPISRIYTYNICLMNCRRNLAIELCKCVPHFYPIIGKLNL